MASTEQKRKWYPEHVTNHADRGKAGFKPKCNWAGAALIAVPNNLDGVYVEPVHPKTAEAWDAYIFLMREFDQSITNAGGVNSCRNIGSTDWPSLHAYLLALDNPPNSRKSKAFQSAVLKVKTNSGVRVFKNLASVNDRMHDEIDCSPAALASGIDWSTVEGYEHQPLETEDNMSPEQEAKLDELIALTKALPESTRKEVWATPISTGDYVRSTYQALFRTEQATQRIEAGQDDLDEVELASLILAGLPAEAIADAIEAGPLVDAVREELNRRLED